MQKKILNKIIIYIFFILFIFISILLRYPFDSFEVGWDSYLYHKGINITILACRIPYYINPLSYFGLTQGAHQSVILILFASLKIVTNFETSWVIWLGPLILTIISSLGILIMMKEIINNIYISLFSAILFDSSNLYVTLSYWTAATRGILLAFFPFIFYFLIVILKEKKFRKTNILLLILYSLILLGSHNLAIPFLAIIVPIFIISYYYFNSTFFKKTSNLSFYFFVILFFILFFIPYYIKIPPLTKYLYYNYLGDNLLIYNILSISYRLNPIYILLAFIFVFNHKHIRDNIYILLFFVCLTSIAIILIIAEYALVYTIFLLIPLTTYGWKILIKPKKIIWTILIVISIFIYIIFFNNVHLGIGAKFLQSGTYIPDRTLNNFGIYEASYINSEISKNNGVIENDGRVVNFIDNPTLPSVNFLNLYYNFTNVDNYERNSPDTWVHSTYTLRKDPNNDYYFIMKDNQTVLLKRYNISYVIEDISYNHSFIYVYKTPSNFLKYLNLTNYKIYVNERYILWRID